MKLVGIIAHKTSRDKVAIATEPPISEAVAKQLKADGGQEGSIKIGVEDGILLLTGSVFPPKEGTFTGVSDFLATAYDTVIKRQQEEERSHNNLVAQYAKAASLPILE